MTVENGERSDNSRVPENARTGATSERSPEVLERYERLRKKYPDEKALILTVTAECDVCGREFRGWQYGGYTAEEDGVCTDCYFEELDGEERKEYAERANRMREERRER